jgi:hypothetical protein
MALGVIDHIWTIADFLNEIPLLIKLDLIRLQIAHHGVMETSTAIAGAKAQAHDHIAAYLRQPLSRANRAAFG